MNGGVDFDTVVQLRAWSVRLAAVVAAEGIVVLSGWALGLDLPTEGPKTLNGLILEHLRDIPEADVSIKIGGVPMEIVHAQGRTVKTVRIFRPDLTAREGAGPR